MELVYLIWGNKRPQDYAVYMLSGFTKSRSLLFL